MLVVKQFPCHDISLDTDNAMTMLMLRHCCDGAMPGPYACHDTNCDSAITVL